MKYILDTNTVIYYFKGTGQVPQRWLAELPTHLAIPTIVIYELRVGIAKSLSSTKRIQLLEILLQTVKVIPFGLQEATASALIRAELEQTGTPIGPIDVLIAGTALAHNATLVTHNVKEFSRIHQLKIVDWY
jgi:tRNA(fMet)-specific endonuclease VapC